MVYTLGDYQEIHASDFARTVHHHTLRAHQRTQLPSHHNHLKAAIYRANVSVYPSQRKHFDRPHHAYQRYFKPDQGVVFEPGREFEYDPSLDQSTDDDVDYVDEF